MKKALLRTLALLFAAVLTLSMAACASSVAPTNGAPSSAATASPTAEPTQEKTPEPTTPPTKAPPVVITIFANNVNGNGKLGVQADPVAQYLADKLGVQISVYKDGTYTTSDQMLGTMLASNDLADVQYMREAKYVEAAVKAGSIIPLDALIQTAPYFSTSLTAKAQIEYNRNQYVKDGKAYTVGLWSGTGLDATPVAGPYIRWDLYKQLGYPAASTNDELVTALKGMLALEPKTADGQAVYAAGGFFGDAGGDFVFMHTFAWNHGIAANSQFMDIDIAKNEMLPCQLTDPDSNYWGAVDFYYKCNQAGILDPDSPTQKMDKYTEKIKAGRYILIAFGWEGRVAKNYMAAIGKPDTAFICLPTQGVDSSLAWTSFLTNQPYAISAACKNPDAAMRLLDFVASPEGARIMYSGLEGQAWKLENGKPVMTDEFISDGKAMDSTAFLEKYGTKYQFFQGFQLNCINPTDGEYMDLAQSPAYIAKSYNSAEKDAIAHYGAKSITDIYLMNKKPFSFVTEYTVMPDKPANLKTDEANITNYLYANIYKCVYAKDDADYAAKKQAFIDGVKKLNIDALYQWYADQYNQNKAKLGPEIQPLLDAWNQTVWNR